MEDTDIMFRNLIDNVYCAFRVWMDNDGVFLVTSKLDMESLKRRLEVEKINKLISAM